MRTGGILLIQTADMSGLQAVSQRENYHYYLPGHLSYFTKDNLRDCLKNSGFSMVQYIGGVEFGLMPKLLKSEAGFKKAADYFKWLRIIFYHFLSKITLLNIHFTSSMVILARK